MPWAVTTAVGGQRLTCPTAATSPAPPSTAAGAWRWRPADLAGDGRASKKKVAGEPGLADGSVHLMVRHLLHDIAFRQKDFTGFTADQVATALQNCGYLRLEYVRARMRMPLTS